MVKYLDELRTVLVLMILIFAIVDILIWTDQIKFVATDTKYLLGALMGVVGLGLFVYYISLLWD